jgi:hypothetical protein
VINLNTQPVVRYQPAGEWGTRRIWTSRYGSGGDPTSPPPHLEPDSGFGASIGADAASRSEGPIMRHYAGLGVSLDKTSVSIIDDAGAFIVEAKVERRLLGLG